MDKKINNTKYLLGESFKELLLKYSFEKITIKMITDGAGVIRPTFYNYFRDKNEVFEWILQAELINPVKAMIDNDMERESIKMIFSYFYKNKSLYRKLFNISGQNSFEDLLIREIYRLFNKILEKHHFKLNNNVRVLSRENISRLYCIGIVYTIKSMIIEEENNKYSFEEIYDGYIFLMSHSLIDIIEN